jgi:polysaccharide export outer membrane protein
MKVVEPRAPLAGAEDETPGDPTPRGRRIARPQVLAALAAATAVALAGCAPTRARLTTPVETSAPTAARVDGGTPSPEVASDGIMSTDDARALATLAKARSRMTAGDEYRIGPDDLLDIRIPDLLDPQASAAGARAGTSGAAAAPVAAAPVFQQGARVNSAGEISIPTLGAVHAAGLTTTALQKDIARRLTAAGILRRPEVSVQIVEYRSGVVAVVGSVEHPGLFPLTRPHASIADLIWAAGGPSKDAGRVVEFAPGPSSAGPTAVGTDPLRLDLNLLMRAAGAGASERNPQVRPGDVISVAPAGSVLVDGWVDKPGSYAVTRGLTVSGAIAAAGGRVFAADQSRATVTRVLGAGRQRAFEVDLDALAAGRVADVPLSDGDVVYVPVAPTRVVPWGLWKVAREMVHVGGSVLLF